MHLRTTCMPRQSACIMLHAAYHKGTLLVAQASRVSRILTSISRGHCLRSTPLAHMCWHACPCHWSACRSQVLPCSSASRGPGLGQTAVVRSQTVSHSLGSSTVLALGSRAQPAAQQRTQQLAALVRAVHELPRDANCYWQPSYQCHAER